MLIKIEDSKAVGYPITNENFYQLFPETSFPFPLFPDAVEPLGYGMYEFSAQPTPGTYEKVVEVSPVKNEQDIWMQTWEVVPMTSEEIEKKNDQLKQDNKAQASWLLSQTDWTQERDAIDPTNPPYLVNADEFKSYRQQLRVIAINPPITVDVWPVKPDEEWSN